MDFEKTYRQIVKLEEARDSLPSGKTGAPRRGQIQQELRQISKEFHEATRSYKDGSYWDEPGYHECFREVMKVDDYYAPKY